jgi:hypothetical protein
MEPGVWAALGGLLVLVGLIVGLAARFRWKARRGWAALAGELGVAYEAPGAGQPYGRVRGLWGGYVVEVAAGAPRLPSWHPLLLGMQRGGKQGGGMYVRVWCEGELGCGLLMTQELPALARALLPGLGPELEVGDAALDGAFHVLASDEEEARRVLTARARAALVGCAELVPFGLAVGDEGPVLYLSQVEADPAKLRSQLERLREAAAALSEGKRGG